MKLKVLLLHTMTSQSGDATFLPFQLCSVGSHWLHHPAE